MTPSEIACETADVYFNKMKETKEPRQWRYLWQQGMMIIKRDLLEQGLRAMGPLEDSEIKAGNMMILAEGGQ